MCKDVTGRHRGGFRARVWRQSGRANDYGYGSDRGHDSACGPVAFASAEPRPGARSFAGSGACSNSAVAAVAVATTAAAE